MLRFDYSGTGSSGGNFEDGTLALWLEEALAAIDRLTEGPIDPRRLVDGRLDRAPPRAAAARAGRGAGRDRRRAGLHRMGLQPTAMTRRERQRASTRGFWESGQQLRLLDGEIAIDCPVRLIHGECDRGRAERRRVPADGRLRSADVQLNLIKGGGHRLSEPHEIEAILRTVAALLEPAP